MWVDMKILRKLRKILNILNYDFNSYLIEGQYIYKYEELEHA